MKKYNVNFLLNLMVIFWSHNIKMFYLCRPFRKLKGGVEIFFKKKSQKGLVDIFGPITFAASFKKEVERGIKKE